MKNLGLSFKHALDGIMCSFKSERNMKIHFFVMILTTILGAFLRLSSFEWIVLVIVYILVIASELFNTSIEIAIDIISPKYSKKAKLSKDIAAGAVFVNALGAVVIGFIIFLPKILDLLEKL